ncbi:DMT family transporter [Alsobacter sp. R-9]
MNTLLGISLKVLATIAFSVMGALIKALTDSIPTGQLVFFRSFFALIPLMLWLGWQGQIADAVRTRDLVGQLRRCVASTAGMYCGFWALSYLPLPDATAIGYVTPIVTTLLAAIVLGEAVRGYRWAALVLGFAGMVVMLLPYLGLGGHAAAGLAEAKGALIGLASATLSAVATLEVRKLAQTERTAAIVFYFSTTASLVGLATAVFAWAPVDGTQLAMLVVAGILGGIGQILLTSSYRFAPISAIAPFDYMTLIWATVLGYIAFGEVPHRLVLLGALIVIAAGLIVIYNEGKAVRKARRTQPPPSP